MALKGQLAEGLVLPVTSTVAKNLPLARVLAAQSCASAYKDALKEYKPQQVKDAE